MSAAYGVAPVALLVCGYVFYLLAAGLGTAWLVSQSASARRFARMFAGGGLLAHGVFLGVLVLARGFATALVTRFEAAIFLISILMLVALLVGAAMRLRSIADFALPTVVLLLTGAACLLADEPAATAGPTPATLWFAAHVAFTLLAYAAFSFGFVLGLMYLALERQLKAKRRGRLFDLLPPLEVVDRLSGRVVLAGFVLLTLGILLGSLGAHGLEEVRERVHTDPKVQLAVLTWGVYLATIALRAYAPFRGRKVMYLSVLGFLLVLFTYFGAQLLGEGFHRF